MDPLLFEITKETILYRRKSCVVLGKRPGGCSDPARRLLRGIGRACNHSRAGAVSFLLLGGLAARSPRRGPPQLSKSVYAASPVTDGPGRTRSGLQIGTFSALRWHGG